MTIRNTKNEQGVALILTLFLMMALSVIGASLMLLSQTETYSSLNYRLMSQARYGAESGIQKTVNYLVYSYAAPTAASATDPTGGYNMTCSPVVLGGQPCTAQPIVLSANPAVASNYPANGGAIQTAFNNGITGNGITGTLTAGATSSAVTYVTSAVLMSMHVVNVYGGGVATIQTWQITSDGSVTATRTATVEVTSVLETPIQPANSYGAFGTSPTCGSLQFTGSSATDSYNSSTPGFNGAVAPSAANGNLGNSGGNVGTNGNLGESGNATIHGTLSSPRVGVGSCSNGNVDALSSSGNAKLCPDSTIACTGIQAGSVVTLPAQVSLQPPTPPSPLPPTGSYTPANSEVIPNGASLGDVSITGNKTVTLGGATCTAVAPCTINMNSLSVSGDATLQISGYVILKIAGTGLDAGTVLSLTGNDVANPGYNPTTFQIQYAGTGSMVIKGNTTTTAMVYAPNANVTLEGNGSFYGSFVGATVIDTGNGNLHYDRRLSSIYYTVGNAMMSAFSWKKY
jgi:Tfp pilus assembly protein PilX